jgi:SAM-dependent methyltransferase
VNHTEGLFDLLQNRPIREVEPGLYSVLPVNYPGQPYDNRALAYDWVIGSRVYNHVFWGTSPKEYRALATQAFASGDSGWLLDAGCGTLLFTAEAYAANPNRRVIALDMSIGMLRRAKSRLADLMGRSPDHITFLQADLLDLPFRTHSFETVVSMDMLHLFDPMESLVGPLHRSLQQGGRIFLSSLVQNARFGDRYMRLLYRAGELARPRNAEELERMLRQSLGEPMDYRVAGNMAYATAPAA